MNNKAWVYCRQASRDEGLTGITTQSNILNDYIKKNNLIPAGETKVLESGMGASLAMMTAARTAV